MASGERRWAREGAATQACVAPAELTQRVAFDYNKIANGRVLYVNDLIAYVHVQR